MNNTITKKAAPASTGTASTTNAHNATTHTLIGQAPPPPSFFSTPPVPRPSRTTRGGKGIGGGKQASLPNILHPENMIPENDEQGEGVLISEKLQIFRERSKASTRKGATP